MKQNRLFLFLFLLLLNFEVKADKHESDSIQKALLFKMDDTLRVKTLRSLSISMYRYEPDSALQFAYEALLLAKKAKYNEGISNAKEMIAIILTRMGNYNKALNYYIDNLKLEEGMKSEDGVICANINIGIVYAYLLDYPKAIENYLRADSLVNNFKTSDDDYVQTLKYGIKLNIGDAYEKMKVHDSAFIYFNQSLTNAVKQNNTYNQGKSMLGLASVYAAQNKNDLALVNYRVALQNLQLANDEDLICEATLGIAKVYNNLNIKDSVLHYARYGLYLSKKDNFISRQLDFSSFLAKFFSKQNKSDSAYYYLSNSIVLKDSILGIEKLRITEQISFNENLRQEELIEKALEEKELRSKQLQHIFIGIFIPLLFIITILLTRARVKVSVIKFSGVISLLFLFEYLTLLLHPIVEEITHHKPILEILVFVCIAALLIPAHHNIEHKLVDLLVKRAQTSLDKILLAKQKSDLKGNKKA